MIAFKVNDMTCGHCASTITRVVKTIDRDAAVDIDLGTHSVTIASTVADEAAFRHAIAGAGYTPVSLPTGSERAAASVAPKRGGCCCG